ncbi:MAG: 30S ribosomal protein S6 [Desulfuromonadaceae bacterium]|nr:30S ribosomal protein S6 [Desulfuromonas sp.]MDY0185703.1 30S ribosomal protein S6 [Desulfuromonadaceae bacterium]
MRTYETIFIIRPQIAGDEYTALLGKYKQILADQSAEILRCQEWGTKRLPYIVKKQDQGTFVLINFIAGNTVVKEFERRLRLDDAIMQFQTVLLEHGLDLNAPEAAAKTVEDDLDDDDSEQDEEQD